MHLYLYALEKHNVIYIFFTSMEESKESDHDYTLEYKWKEERESDYMYVHKGKQQKHSDYIYIYIIFRSFSSREMIKGRTI